MIDRLNPYEDFAAGEHVACAAAAGQRRTGSWAIPGPVLTSGSCVAR